MLRRFLTQATLVILIILSITLAGHAVAAGLLSGLSSTPSNLATSSPKAEPKLPASKDLRLIVKRARDAWIAGDGETFASLFAPDGEFIVPGDRRVGPAAIRQVAADFAAAYSVVKIDIRRIIVDGNQAVVEWFWQDKEKATGTYNSADDAIVVDFKAGKISRWREYIDPKTPT